MLLITRDPFFVALSEAKKKALSHSEIKCANVHQRTGCVTQNTTYIIDRGVLANRFERAAAIQAHNFEAARELSARLGTRFLKMDYCEAKDVDGIPSKVADFLGLETPNANGSTRAAKPGAIRSRKVSPEDPLTFVLNVAELAAAAAEAGAPYYMYLQREVVEQWPPPDPDARPRRAAGRERANVGPL